jgi:hypothetical protein
MTRKLLIAVGLALCSTMAAAQSDRSGDTSKDRSATPSGTQPATPATPADPGMSPATPATPATPGKAQAGGKKDFASLDADGDGSLSKDEAKVEATIKFSELDTDKDGKLSNAEFAAFESKSKKR